MPVHVKDLFQSIITEIREGSFEVDLISSENFCFMTPEYITEIAQIFESYNCKIIYYVRHQTALIESTYLEWQKSGGEYLGNIDSFFNRHQNSFSFMKRIEPWVNCFGKDRICSRLFDKRVIGDDVCSDILNLVGVDDSIVTAGEITTANSSLLPEFSNLIALYDETKSIVTERQFFIDELLLISNIFKRNSKASLVSDDLRKKIINKYKITNREFSDLFLDESQATILNRG